MREIKLDKYGHPIGIYCPVMTCGHPEGGIEFVTCQGDCAWFKTDVREDGSIDCYCKGHQIGTVEANGKE